MNAADYRMVGVILLVGTLLFAALVYEANSRNRADYDDQTQGPGTAPASALAYPTGS